MTFRFTRSARIADALSGCRSPERAARLCHRPWPHDCLACSSEPVRSWRGRGSVRGGRSMEPITLILGALAAGPLAKALAETGTDADPAVIEAARHLMELLDETGARAGKYNVDLRGAQGVQV